MNPDMKTTLGFAGTAAALLVLVLATGAKPRESEVFVAQGKPFYPEFTDPLKATALEVLEFDEAQAAPRHFRVEFGGGKWTIPSHSHYPADAKERLAKTATSVLDLKKDQIASTTEKDHESLGVVDPLSPTGPPAGRGRRVKFYVGATAVADYIFGKDAGDGKRYVRVPDDKRTYVTKTPGEISSKFEDWVETDLLDLSATAIRKITIDKYSFDVAAESIKDRQVNVLTREDSSKPWTLGELKPEEDVNTENVSTMTSALDDLRIAGVRPKPGPLAKMKDLAELQKMNRGQAMLSVQELANRGYFLTRDMSLICTEGEMTAACDDGVVYLLRFGDALIGTGEEITAGTPSKKPEDKKDPKKDEKKGGTENRYLFVTVRFDESLLGAPPLEPTPYVADPSKKPEEQKAAEDAAKKAREEYESKKKERESKVEAGKKRADKLAARFAEWYYVISAEAFKKLRLDRPGLVKPKEKKPEDKKDEKHDDKDGHKHDEKEPPKKPGDGPKPTDEKKPPESPKSQEPSPKPDAPKPEEKKPDAPKADEKPVEKKS